MKSDKWKYILSHKDISLEYTMLFYRTLEYDAPFKGQKHVPRYKKLIWLAALLLKTQKSIMDWEIQTFILLEAIISTK